MSRPPWTAGRRPGAKKTLHMETTQKTPAQSAADIIHVLSACEFVASIDQRILRGKMEGISFSINLRGQPFNYQLKANPDGVFAVLQGRARRPRQSTKNHRDIAARVAWRQLFRWVEAQVGLVECGAATPLEVFLPYCIVGPSGQTSYERFTEQVFKQLSAAGETAT